ncbi:DsbC family protein [Geobacter sp. DSM 9736]|uniref:DsbC family protein n=1 Tax=Geobacter sp. DSM 9736 TaxID=1277350 RepID=UPI000B511259|nr:DsbC family protein [Geobacter sp. DSM 9736]SNB46400.1 thiol:disulfide interchange protein DsbC [Geobacter sp. DSM 9736]
MKSAVPALLFFASTATSAFAMLQQGCGGDCAGCHTLTVKEANALLTGMGEVKQVKTPPVRGLWELHFEKEGKKAVAYIDYGKKYVIPGPVYSIATRSPITGEAPPKPAAKKVNVSAIPLADSITMGNPKGKKRLFVFTDPDCPFCSKLHTELKKLVKLEPDVAVYIKLFPLKMHPKAYDKSRAIMQGSDPGKLLDEAFRGGSLPAPAPQGAKGVDETIRIAGTLGINATPTLVLPDGSVLPGYRKAEEIKRLMAKKKK